MKTLISKQHPEENDCFILAKEQLELQRWFNFFSRVTSELVGSEQIDTLLNKIPHLTVPGVADACMLFLSESRSRSSGFACSPAYSAEMVELDINHLLSTPESYKVSPHHAIRSGQRELKMPDPKATRSGISSVLCMPLKSGPNVFGSLVLALCENKNFSTGDITIIECYAHRCALVLENAYIQKKLEREKSKLALITDAIPAQVAYIDRNKKYQFCNQSYKKWFGFNDNSIVGQSIHEVLGEKNLEHLQTIQNSALSGFSVSLQTKLENLESEERWFEVSDIPDISEDGSVNGFVELIYDLSERKKIEERLKEAKDLADSANRTKSQFLANISHEVRTPINVVLGFADLIINSSEPIETKIRWARKIYENGEHLLKIVNDILDTSKIESNSHELKISKEKVNLFKLFGDIHSSLCPVAEKKNIFLQFKNELNESEKFVYTDGTRLRQILINLINNAIKFTDHGHVKVTLKTEPTYPDCFSAIISDTGCGISQEDVLRLFKPFSQVQSSTQPVNGTGLGLALSKKIANLLGGDVVIDKTVLGEGSAFRLTLPKASSLAEIESLHQPTKDFLLKRSYEGFHDHHVLVIDDSEDSRELTALYLESFGAIVSKASNGYDGIQMALSQDFSLILTDIRMPGLSGYQVASILRDQQYSKPIVALTANAFGDEVSECIKSGCNSAISKPIGRQKLYSHLTQYLKEETLH